ncbi:thiamine pyrophosphate-binding protein [Bosea vestrisii]|uniref:thiamine pyrophosphate-binding protein n=1 Tax=Bosea vestrisii TaxID=151416 RepID=UPI0032636C4D
MRGADILVEMLIGYGVEVVFGVPGDTNVPFYEALQLCGFPFMSKMSARSFRPIQRSFPRKSSTR